MGLERRSALSAARHRLGCGAPLAGGQARRLRLCRRRHRRGGHPQRPVRAWSSSLLPSVLFSRSVAQSGKGAQQLIQTVEFFYLTGRPDTQTQPRTAATGGRPIAILSGSHRHIMFCLSQAGFLPCAFAPSFVPRPLRLCPCGPRRGVSYVRKTGCRGRSAWHAGRAAADPKPAQARTALLRRTDVRRPCSGTFAFFGARRTAPTSAPVQNEPELKGIWARASAGSVWTSLLETHGSMVHDDVNR